MQSVIPLGQGNGALTLTTARYFTPSGRSIQAKGISPDIEVLQDLPDELKAGTDSIGEASLRGHLKAEEMSRPARSPISLRNPRTTKHSIPHSMSFAGFKKARDTHPNSNGPVLQGSRCWVFICIAKSPRIDVHVARQLASGPAGRPKWIGNYSR